MFKSKSTLNSYTFSRAYGKVLCQISNDLSTGNIHFIPLSHWAIFPNGSLSLSKQVINFTTLQHCEHIFYIYCLIFKKVLQCLEVRKVTCFDSKGEPFRNGPIRKHQSSTNASITEQWIKSLTCFQIV